MHRGGIVLIFLILLLRFPVLPCLAAQERGTIRVTLEPDMAQSVVVLRRVGIQNADGLELGPFYGGGYVTGADLRSRELAHWLAEQGGAGTEKQASRDGTVMFSGLEEGMYLLTQKVGCSGFCAMEPTLVAIPEEDGSWYAQVCPAVAEGEYIPPETGSPIPPVFSAMGMVLSGWLIGIWYENWHMQRRK